MSRLESIIAEDCSSSWLVGLWFIVPFAVVGFVGQSFLGWSFDISLLSALAVSVAIVVSRLFQLMKPEAVLGRIERIPRPLHASKPSVSDQL
jgi:hypothetical protein